MTDKEYMILESRSMGYALLKRNPDFWQQVSKWYMYLGNLKRFNPKARNIKRIKTCE